MAYRLVTLIFGMILLANFINCYHVENQWTFTAKNKLNIHLVSHTHNDVGWLKTVDQYYYGGL